MQATAIPAESVLDTLDAVSRLHAVRADAEAALFELAAAFADQHAGDTLPVEPPGPAGDGTRGPGRWCGHATDRGVRLRRAGRADADGPLVRQRYVADALDVRHRLPLIWARVVAREARVGNARLVATRTRHLSVEAAAVVDAAMAPFVDGSLPWGRFEARLAGKVVAADPRRPRPGRPSGWRSSSRSGPGPARTARPGSTCGPPSG